MHVPSTLLATTLPPLLPASLSLTRCRPSAAPPSSPGASVAINGTCLTVTEQRGPVLRFDVMAETLRRTNLGALDVGTPVNFERRWVVVTDRRAWLRLLASWGTCDITTMWQLLLALRTCNWL